MTDSAPTSSRLAALPWGCAALAASLIAAAGAIASLFVESMTPDGDVSLLARLNYAGSAIDAAVLILVLVSLHVESASRRHWALTAAAIWVAAIVLRAIELQLELSDFA